ncbi:MAG: hypothetical protein H8E40_00450 [Chloroflexi bacterium]|nr:hypothetical protein [Chloroflexota bacterium]
MAFIEQPEIIKKILKHLGLWEVKARPPPKTNAPQPNVHIDKAARPVRIISFTILTCPPQLMPIEAYI